MDDRHLEVPGALEPSEALRGDPGYELLKNHLTNPVALGIVLALLIIAMVILSPSAQSNFIYTDF